MPDNKTKQGLWDFLQDEWRKWLARSVIAATVFTFLAVATPFGHQLLNVWKSPEKLEGINHKLDELAAAVLAITGENRVTRQPEDMSYVREPVYAGDAITLILFIGRTEAGSGCILKGFIAQFTDENNVTLSGDPRRPRAQLSAEVVRRVVVLEQPGGMVAGRTRVQLQMEYQCGGETVFELTKPVFYYVKERT